MRGGALLVLLLGLARPLAAQGSVHVDATVAPAATRVGEPVRFEVVVRTPGSDPTIEAPRLPDGLEVVGTRDFTELEFRLPGGRSRVLRRQFLLRAAAPGRYRIPPVVVTVGSAVYRTRPLLLVVQGEPMSFLDGAPPNEVMLRVDLLPDTAYVGQEVTLRAEALFSDAARARLRRPPEYLPPSPSGFWVHDSPDQISGGSRTIGGRSYQYQAFHRIYFPLAPGTYVLPPARLTYETSRGFLSPPETHELASDSARLVVLPLPTAGRPPSFTGAVGRYRIRAALESDRVAVGEPAVLTVEVEGTGNIKALPAPALPGMPGVEVSQPTETAEYDEGAPHVRGVKTFSWMLVPAAPGTLEIPAIEYAYFDPLEEAYGVAAAQPLALAVEPGAAAPGRSTASTGLRPLAASPAPPPLGWVRSGWFAALQLVPMLGLILVVARRREAARPRGPSVRERRRRRRAELDDLRRLTEEPGREAEVAGRIEALLRRAVADWAGQDAARAAPDVLGRRLAEAGLDPELAGGLAAMLGTLRAARYTSEPAGPGAGRVWLTEAERLLKQLRRTRRRSGAHAWAAAGALALLLAAGALAAAEPGDDFRAGVAAYAAGRYEAAASRFTAYVRARPGDAAGWYDLGNAQHRAGRTGHAVRAWIEALERAPRHEEARHNLLVAGVAPETLDLVAPAPPISTDELLLGLSLVWFVGAAGIGLWLARGARSRPAAAATLALAGVLALGAWAAMSRGGGHAVVVENSGLVPAPVLQAEPLQRLEPGAIVEVRERRPGWLLVRTGGGGEGWLEESDVLRL